MYWQTLVNAKAQQVNTVVQASAVSPGAMVIPRLQTLKADLVTVGRKLASMEGKRDLLLQQRDEAVIKRAEAQNELDSNDLVQILLQKSSDYARQQAKTRIEEIVTSALTVVYGEAYEFRLDLQVRSNRPELDYYLKRGDIVTQLKPPDYDNGGGIVDVITLALRLAVAELDNVKGTLWLDEIGKHVSARFAPHVAFFLKEYSEKFKRQMVLITHNSDLAEAGDLSLAVSYNGNRSEVRAI